jgi:O-antigen/teichoic acid export membrane protein
MIINRIKARLQKSEFIRHVLILMTGSGLASAITLLVSPVLTRAYTPENFGVFAAFAAVTSILGGAAALRYELAVVLPDKEGDALNTGVAAFLSTLLVSCLVALFLLAFLNKMDGMFEGAALMPYLFIVPLVILFAGVNNILKYYLNRFKNYKTMSAASISQAMMFNITAICLGWIGWGVWGLIIGTIIGSIASIAILLYRAGKLSAPFRRSVSLGAAYHQAIEYKEFPIYSTFAGITGSLAHQVHVFLFMWLYGSATVGIIFLAMRIMFQPLNIISVAFSKVYYGKIARIKDPDHLRKLYAHGAVYLSGIVAMLIAFIWLIPYQTIGFIFGNEWTEAMSYMRILVFWAGMQFVASSLSGVFNVQRKQHLVAYLQILNIVTAAVTIFTGYYLGFAVLGTLTLFVAGKIVTYFCVLLWPFAFLQNVIDER